MPITAMILTHNEEANIARTLEAVAWVKEILIIDSGSTDSTIDIVAKYSNARVVERAFDSFADQCNFGLSKVATPWVLSLDADYELTPEIQREIQALSPGDAISGLKARFIYRVFGRPLRATLYPPRTVLYRPQRATYRNEGHGHRVVIEGEVLTLKGAIWHDDRKSLSRWLASQSKYARLEADHLESADRRSLGLSDRIRLMAWPAPLLVGMYALIAKGCILDGRAGWYYVLQRVLAEILVALELLDRRIRGGSRTRG